MGGLVAALAGCGGSSGAPHCGTTQPGNFSYCVEESRLHLLHVSTTMTTPTGQSVIKADVVLGKQ